MTAQAARAASALPVLVHWAARSALIVSTMARNSRQASWQARMARSAAETKADAEVFGSSQRPVIDDAKAALVNQELAAVVIGDRMIAIWLLDSAE